MEMKMKLFNLSRGYFSASVIGLLLALSTSALANITQITVTNQAGEAQVNVPVTLGHVFKSGDVPSGATLGARLPDNTGRR
jgi:hypothetical protein